ncbi:DUF692 domain-containing protein [Ideonella sp. 4Y11]|uniref:UPF0276 protein KAK06_01180 n=1 Tax=Ideonella aquatica TaxID=2824119 RepID=A0A940YF19_9BURK|nr:DUF692 domain-containing protein [Ideonella aquatica]MBQ0957557.1 DUF692 domain-containing protein [Ideonella aquatica]
MGSGFGIGLRTEHYGDFRARPPREWGLDWLEIISENYLVPGGRPLAHLDAIRRDIPIAMHGVSLAIGSTEALDRSYLRELRALIDRVQPCRISDHLCWGRVDHRYLHDLLPLPYTEAMLRHVVERISQVQDALGQRLLLENVSSYVGWQADEMDEARFLAEVAQRADCEILLDVNNVWVSAQHHGFDPQAFIDAMPPTRVTQLHLAGHQMTEDGPIDTHDHPVSDPVWALYAHTVRRLGAVPVMIERDDAIPPLPELLAELDTARRVARAALSEAVPA